MGRQRKGEGDTVLISVRITDDMRFGLEMLKRKRGDSLSGVIEQAIERAFEDGLVERTDKKRGGKLHLLKDIWRADEGERVVRLAIYRPELLSDEEKRAWGRVQDNQKYWIGDKFYQGLEGDELLEKVNMQAVISNWEKLK